MGTRETVSTARWLRIWLQISFSAASGRCHPWEFRCKCTISEMDPSGLTSALGGRIQESYDVRTILDAYVAQPVSQGVSVRVRQEAFLDAGEATLLALSTESTETTLSWSLMGILSVLAILSRCGHPPRRLSTPGMESRGSTHTGSDLSSYLGLRSVRCQGGDRSPRSLSSLSSDRACVTGR